LNAKTSNKSFKDVSDYLPAPHVIIRIRRKLVIENYEKYGPIDPLYEQEKEKNRKSKKDFSLEIT